ncbi:DUF2868 domain-containing protein [Thermodesulfobacteriota bacterium]
MRKERWSIKDIIDFEYFLQADENSSQASLAKRDRAIYLEHIRPADSQKQASPPGYAFKAWLEKRRALEKAGPERHLPGETFHEIYRLLLYVMLIGGFLVGAGLAFSFLNYKGTEPLNVSAYLGGFVFTQVFLLLFFILMVLIRSLKKHPLRSSVIFILVSGLIGKLMYRVKRSSMKALSGSQRDSLNAAVRLVQGKRQVYGTLFYWPIFLLSQFFMVTLNFGVLCATLLKVIGADIAFGWQSTVQFGAEFVFDLVKTIALPWSWLFPSGTAHPTLNQVEGSHMVLKDGIYHLATEDLVSWWPFLCLALLFYGLLPRIILLFLGLISERKALSRIDFSHHSQIRLYKRMKTPVVETEGHSVDGGLASEDGAHTFKKSEPLDGAKPEKDIIALIPDEIYDACPEEELRKIVFDATGSQILDRIKFNEEDKIDGEFFIKYSQSEKKGIYPAILLLQEAWQPPIREALLLLKNLRRAVGKSASIRVGLIGRPSGNRFFTPVKEDDWKAWDKKIKTLEDPYLDLERLELHAS